ncbi:MAG: hypothetical protein RI883_1218 [Bacteroidota bacterium]|jgi:acyl carrier protein
MELEELVRNRVLKIVNSKTHFPVKDGYICDKDLRKELHLNEDDIRIIVAQLEKYFKILLLDEEINSFKNINEIVKVILILEINKNKLI